VRGRRVSFVVIGLNEADHLGGSVASCTRQGLERDCSEIIYVDSGSTDGSPEIAVRSGADRVLHLESEEPNAARARNLGLSAVTGEFVQFVDGDTELASGWVSDGVAALESDPGLAGVEGDLREAHRTANLYHAVCELDWPASPGDVPYVSGNSLYRVDAIRRAGGFDPRMQLGEEPELGMRLRQQGWRFVHLDRLMARHDLAMQGFADWWRRGYRSGLTCAMVVRATGGRGRGFWHERLSRTLGWGAVLVSPWLAALALLPFAPGGALTAAALGGFLVAALAARKALALDGRQLSPAVRIAFGLHAYLVKIPSSVGILTAWAKRLPRR